MTSEGQTKALLIEIEILGKKNVPDRPRESPKAMSPHESSWLSSFIDHLTGFLQVLQQKVNLQGRFEAEG